MAEFTFAELTATEKEIIRENLVKELRELQYASKQPLVYSKSVLNAIQYRIEDIYRKLDALN